MRRCSSASPSLSRFPMGDVSSNKRGKLRQTWRQLAEVQEIGDATLVLHN